MAGLDYTVNKDDAQEGFDIVPAAEYLAIIEESDYIPTKNGAGKILKLTYQIIDGPMKGRKIFNNLNLENPNKQAEEIARRSLNSIGIAVGIDVIKDSSQLHNIPIKIDVKVKDSAEYGKQNRINKHSPAEKSVQAPAPVQQSEPTGDTTGGGQPWNK